MRTTEGRPFTAATSKFAYAQAFTASTPRARRGRLFAGRRAQRRSTRSV